MGSAVDKSPRNPSDKGALRGSTAPPPSSGGIALNDAQYQKLCTMVYNMCGIHLGEHKRELLKARLAKRLRALKLTDIRTYMQLLREDRSGQELVNFLDVITTNKTDFFREPQHFDYLANKALPKLDKTCGASEPLRIWSAACSSGEEPYTLAMVLSENRALLGSRGATILASDLSTEVLQRAQRGVYANEKVATIPRALLTKYFQRGANRWAGHVRVKENLRKMISFSRINLMDNFSFDQPFHYIFCRNVMIYFDKPTVERLVGKFHRCLVPGGLLFVGHSESLAGIVHNFKFVQPATYVKGS